MFELLPIEGELEGKTLYLEPRTLYDACIIEVKEGVAYYSVDKILCALQENFLEDLVESGETLDLDLEDQASMMAIEWFDFNIAGAYMGDYTPIYVIEEGDNDE